MTRSSWAIFLIAAFSVSACAHSVRRVTRKARAGAKLSSSQEQVLLDEAKEKSELGPDGPDLEGAWKALDALLISSSTHAEAGLLATEVLYYLTLDAPPERVETLVDECLEIGAELISAAESASAHYRYAVCLGAKARANKMGALDLIPQMVEQAKRAEELDASIYHAGPSRMLAALYAKSPDWPMSVGDIDSAIEKAEKAMEIAPEWPDNVLWMADVLERDDEDDKARELLARAKELMAAPELVHRRRLWAAHLAELEERLAD